MGLIVSVLWVQRGQHGAALLSVPLANLSLSPRPGQVSLLCCPSPCIFLPVVIAAWCERLLEVTAPSHWKSMRTASGSMGSFFAVIPASSRTRGKSWQGICWPTGNLRPFNPVVSSWFRFFLIVEVRVYACNVVCSFLGIRWVKWVAGDIF